jgi:hypothetical protein
LDGHWPEIQMDTPRILRVGALPDRNSFSWIKVVNDENDRWDKRYPVAKKRKKW